MCLDNKSDLTSSKKGEELAIRSYIVVQEFFRFSYVVMDSYRRYSGKIIYN